MERLLLQLRAGKAHILKVLAHAGVLLGALLLFGPGSLSAAPLVFDFEDGLHQSAHLTNSGGGSAIRACSSAETESRGSDG